MKTKIHKIRIKDIKVFSGRRSLQNDKVRIIADSMNKIGLKTPITVRKCRTGIRLVAGLHRLEAAKLLGLKKIDAFQQPDSKNDASLWEDSENLHRAELTVLERADRIERWRKATQKKAKVAQAARPGGRQPKDAGITKTAKKCGFSRDEVSRAKKIAHISPKVKAKVKNLGLADNQAALLAIAKAPTPKAQRAKLKAIVSARMHRAERRLLLRKTAKSLRLTPKPYFWPRWKIVCARPTSSITSYALNGKNVVSSRSSSQRLAVLVYRQPQL